MKGIRLTDLINTTLVVSFPLYVDCICDIWTLLKILWNINVDFVGLAVALIEGDDD